MFPISSAADWQERDGFHGGLGSVRRAFRLLTSLIGLKGRAGEDELADELALFPYTSR